MQFSRIPIAHRHFYICICLISKSRPICIVVSIVRNTNIQLLWLQPNHWRCSRVTGCHEWETICCRYCCCCCFCCVRKKPVYISIHAKQCRWMWLGYEVWLGERAVSVECNQWKWFDLFVCVVHATEFWTLKKCCGFYAELWWMLKYVRRRGSGMATATDHDKSMGQLIFAYEIAFRPKHRIQLKFIHLRESTKLVQYTWYFA